MSYSVACSFCGAPAEQRLDPGKCGVLARCGRCGGAEEGAAEATIADVIEGRARWCVVEGDCLDVLPTIERVDAVVTDPPYASGARTEAKKSSSGAMMRGARWAAKPIENDQMTTTGFLWLMRSALNLVRDALPEGGSVLAFIDWRQWPHLVGAVESTNLRVNGMVVWDKGTYGLGNGFRSQHELVCFASRGTPRVSAHDTGNVLTFERVEPEDHPSPKPVPLMEALLRVVTEPNDVVLDPFCGSGSTGCAALRLGRRFIGIEKDAAYARIASDRLRAEEQNSTLTAARAGQLPLLAGASR